jgi:voltage-gated potassium channel
MPPVTEKSRFQILVKIERRLEGPLILLGFVWLILILVELVWGVNKTLEYISVGIWLIFILDFLVKLILAPEKLRFLKTNWLTILSLVIPALRVFRLARLVRVLRGLRSVRLVRLITSFNRSIKSLAATMQRMAFGYVMALVAMVTLGGAAGMHAFEREHEGFRSYSESLWWTAMRVITAGTQYDPVTSEGRVLAFLIAVFGYAVFGYITATIASYFIGKDVSERKNKN